MPDKGRSAAVFLRDVLARPAAGRPPFGWIDLSCTTIEEAAATEMLGHIQAAKPCKEHLYLDLQARAAPPLHPTQPPQRQSG